MSNATAANFLTTVLQTVEVPNSYWFLFEPTIYIIIYLPITIYHISNL